jgi:tetratricopeptide (TPR) repeat protein
LALGEGRASDARLNFEKALALAGSGGWDAEKARAFCGESLSGLAAVSESREDWKSARDRLNAWLELEPRNGQARQRLGRVLFGLDKPEDAFAALTQAVKDEPALEPAAISMGWLYSQKADSSKAEEWFDFARGRTQKCASSPCSGSLARGQGSSRRRQAGDRRGPQIGSRFEGSAETPRADRLAPA